MKEFSWQAPEYTYKEKTSDWYWTVGIITAALVVTAIIFGNTLFGIVIAIGAFSLSLFASRKPNIVSVHISEKGIKIDKTLYPFHTIDSFYLHTEHPTGPKLLLKSKKMVMPLVSVPVNHNDHETLREFIAKHLKEEVFEEGLLQTIFDGLGF